MPIYSGPIHIGAGGRLEDQNGNIIDLTQLLGAALSAYTQTYSTANRTVAAPTSAVLTYPGSGNLFDAVAADLLINVRTDSTANAVADIVVNLKSIADALNQLIADDLDNRQAINSIIDDLQALDG